MQVESGGTATLTDSILAGNSSQGGGAINDNGGLTLIDCTIADNTATTSGGGLQVESGGMATLTDSTLSGNSSEYGGAINDNGGLTLIDCTLADNTADQAGGLRFYSGTAAVNGGTIADNTASTAGGGLFDQIGTLTVGDTIIAGNTSPSGPDVDGSVTSEGHNLLGNTSGMSGAIGSDLTGMAADLGPLAYNGGPTETLALLTGSPAIDAGNNALIPSGQIDDQRGPGYDRIVNGTVDIGAFEVQPVYTVTDLRDTAGSSSDVTLRYAITQADANPNSTIDFGVTGTIALASALPDLIANVAITGPGATSLTIQGGGPSSRYSYSILVVDAGVTASLSGLTISGGSATVGAGLEVKGTVTVTDCTIADNTATTSGGGLQVESGGTATLTDSTLSGNSSAYGGAINDNGGLTLIDCTLADNTADQAGGLRFYSGTAAVNGGTIADNTASIAGGGLFDQIGTLTVGDTIIAGNTSPSGPDVDGSVTSEGHNLLGNTSGMSGAIGSDLTGMAADLGPLAYNGGPTETLALLLGSPAIDAGNNALIPSGQIDDQRGPGYARIVNGTVDIGAYELRLYTVTDPADTAGSSSDVTLRYAIAQADAHPYSTIDFSVTGTIALTSALPDLSANVAITGPGATSLTIQGGGPSSDYSIFTVDAGVTASLSGLTISGGSATVGAGLEVKGTVTVTDCTIADNTATTSGGGLQVESGGMATLTDSTLSGNSSAYGGAINDNGGLTLIDCTLADNTADQAGGLRFYSGTAAVNGGTIADNTASTAGGGLFDQIGTLTVGDTIIAGNTSPSGPDVDGSVTSEGHNLLGNTSGMSGAIGSDLTGMAADLGPLAYNGGPTETLALLLGSPAIDAGNNALIPSGQIDDQRGPGYARIVNGTVDIGAYELRLYTVNDTGSGAGSSTDVTLSYAIAQADANPNSTIDFSVTGVIQEYPSVPTITADVTIIGPGASSLTIKGYDNEAPLHFVSFGVIAISYATVSLSGLTIADGYAAFGADNGGGITNTGGTLAVTDCTISDNDFHFGSNGGHGGGGIYNTGAMTLTDCTISGNSCDYRGGGGIANLGTMTLVDCTISENDTVDNGGGIYNTDAMTLTNCTVSGNTGVDGGGIYNRYSMTLSDCTISANAANHGGGISAYNSPPTIGNTIVAGNTASTGTDVWGSVSSEGNNLFGDANFGLLFGGQPGYISSDLLGQPADLGELAENGGPTETMALLPGSAAFNAGNNALIPPGQIDDQRGPGYDRIVDGTVDIGAFEAQTLAPWITTQPSAQTVVVGASATFTTAADGLPAPIVQWEVSTNGGTSYTAITGATTASLVLSDVTASMSGELYEAVFTNGEGAATTLAAQLTVALVPMANPRTVNVLVGTATSLTLTASDPTSPPLPLTYTVTTEPADGTLSGTAPDLTYTPDYGFLGTDSFTFTASNGYLTSPAATVTLDVVGTPTATGQTVNVLFQTDQALTLTGSDPDLPPLPLTYVVATEPADGTLSGIAPNLTYTPDAGFLGTDSFTFTASNGYATSIAATVALFVVSMPTANGQTVNLKFETAASLTLTGSDPDLPPLPLTYAVATESADGTLRGTAPNLTYTPDAGFHGTDSFTFTVSNGYFASPAATVTLDVPAPITYTVTDPADTAGSSSDLTLPYAIAQADANPNSTIDFSVSGTIALASALPDLSANVTITGPGATSLTIQGGGPSSDYSIFTVAAGVTASLSGLTISGGSATVGAGLEVKGTVTVTDCTIADNTATTSGGGLQVESRGTATLTDCHFSGNSSVHGGAINDNGGLALTDCTVSGNTADQAGGLRVYSGTAAVTDCTISGDSAGNGGGGIANYQSGNLTVSDCTISGDSAGNGGGIANSGALTVSDCTISGDSAGNGGGIANYDSGYLTVSDCTISGDSAGNEGGGIANSDGIANSTGFRSYDYSRLTVSGCTISGDSAGKEGGGIANSTGFRSYDYFGLTVSDCTISGDSAGKEGGGIANSTGLRSDDYSKLTVSDSTISGDSAGNGGGIYNSAAPSTLYKYSYAALTVSDCTISGDSAGNGGGIYDTHSASLTVFSSTIANNTARSSGGGLAVLRLATALLYDTIVAENVTVNGTPDDVVGGALYGTGDLIGADSSSFAGIIAGSNGNQVGTTTTPIDPMLAPLGDYGGPTQTMALLPGSPAIAAGDGYADPTDQRGEPLASPPDIGAFQTQAGSLVVNAISTVTAAAVNAPVGSITVTLNEPAGPGFFTTGALTLTDNGESDLITDAVSITLVSGSTSTYSIGGLSTLTTAEGSYTLTVNAADIFDPDFNTGTGSLSTSWLMDTTPPTSHANALAARGTSLSFPVSVTGSDPTAADGGPASGVATYAIYASINGGTWSPWTTVPASNPTATYTGQSNTTYSFYSIATDLAGNVENKRPTIEGSTYLPDLTPPVTVVNATTGTNPSTVNGTTGTFTLDLTGNDPGGAALTYFEVFVSVNGGTYHEVGPYAIPAGFADSSGHYHSTIAYQGLTDGQSHSYEFYSIGLDAAGNLQGCAEGSQRDLRQPGLRVSPAESAPGQQLHGRARQPEPIVHPVPRPRLQRERQPERRRAVGDRQLDRDRFAGHHDLQVRPERRRVEQGVGPADEPDDAHGARPRHRDQLRIGWHRQQPDDRAGRLLRGGHQAAQRPGRRAPLRPAAGRRGGRRDRRPERPERDRREHQRDVGGGLGAARAPR